MKAFYKRRIGRRHFITNHNLGLDATSLDLPGSLNDRYLWRG